MALEGGNGANCGHHLFDGLDAQYADATASFIETYNHLFLEEPPPPAVVALTANTVAELRQAIATANQAPQQAHAIAMGASLLQFDAPAAAGDALPHVIGQVVLQPSPALQAQGVVLRGGGPGSGFRLASVGQGGSLEVAGITAEDFHAAGNGGVLAFGAGSRGHVRRSSFVGNAAANGGAIHAAGALAVSDSRFVGNQAEGHGGAINLRGSGATVIERNVFEDNVAGSSGGTLRVSGCDMTMTSGGVFGPGFDPDAVVRTRVGGASFVFSDCDAVDRPGHFAFQASHPGAFEDLATSANRLTAILPCSGSPAALVHRSGSYYDPARSGEGVFVQYLPNGGVVLVFYGYTPQGQQFWAIAGSTTLDGDTLTAQMVYPAGTSRFGSHFSPDEVELQPWGTMTLQHTGCNTARLGYHSTIAGYGSGSHDYVRLTAIDGTRCP